MLSCAITTSEVERVVKLESAKCGVTDAYDFISSYPKEICRARNVVQN